MLRTFIHSYISAILQCRISKSVGTIIVCSYLCSNSYGSYTVQEVISTDAVIFQYNNGVITYKVDDTSEKREMRTNN